MISKILDKNCYVTDLPGFNLTSKGQFHQCR